MRRSRFSDEQIVGFVQDHEASGGTAKICRRAGITLQTLYRWKAKYGGLQVSDAKRLRALEGENARLKRLVAEQALDNQVLKELLRKNVWRPPPSGQPPPTHASSTAIRSAAPAPWWACIVLPYATGLGLGATRQGSSAASMSSLHSGRASGTGGCTSCCGGRG